MTEGGIRASHRYRGGYPAGPIPGRGTGGVGGQRRQHSLFTRRHEWHEPPHL